MRTLAIGDIHGCATALETLLRALEPQPSDRLIFLGDYIDRGPDSRKVIDCLINLDSCGSKIFIRGNHEVMILDARESFLKMDIWQSCGGLETAFSYGANYGQSWFSAIPDTHWAFFENTVPCFETDTHLFVHACLDPDLDLSDQPDWLLYWEPFQRMQPHKSGKKVICGHTPQRKGITDLGFAACIDTAAATGGWLSALDVGSGRFWQANQKGETRSGSLNTG